MRSNAIGTRLGCGRRPRAGAPRRGHAGSGVRQRGCRPRGTIELAFTAREHFTNPTGNALGAFVAAMLYDTVGTR